jgi:hypothetical protein
MFMGVSIVGMMRISYAVNYTRQAWTSAVQKSNMGAKG